MANLRDRLFSGIETRNRIRQARRRRAVTLEGLENRIVLTQLQYGLFDTGVDNSGNALVGGDLDTHYTLPVTQLGTAGMNASLVSPLAGGWVPNAATHAWIGPATDTSTAPPGTYQFRTTFNVTSTGGGGELSGSITGDNDLVDILINGVSTGYSQTNAFTGFVPFSVKGGIVSGTNTVDFIISNGGNSPNPVGFHARDLALNFLPTLTIGQSNISASSGSSVVNSGTFADPDQGDTVTITSDRGTVQQSGANSGTYQYFEPNVTSDGTVTITATDSKGGVTTQTFTITSTPNQPPVLTGGGGNAATERSGAAGVVIDPNIVVSDNDGPNLTTASVSISTATFVATEDRLLFTNQNGITGNYNSSTGILTLSGSATAADYQTALRSVKYQNINAGSANTTPRSISFSIAPGAFSQATGHFYEFVSAQGISWTDARLAANSRDIYGLKGYLATLTSAAENNFAFSKVQSVGWIGASDAAVEGEWRWIDGPEAGLQFWQGLGGSGSAVNGMYNNWSDGEPNNAGNEDYAHFLGNGEWNDYANTTPVQGYVVEYGGSAGDPTLTLTSTMLVNVVNVTDTPVVASPTVTTTTNSATILINGTAQAGSLIQIYDDENDNGIIDMGEMVVASQQLGSQDTNYGVAVPLFANGENHFIVTAKLANAAESTQVVVPTITSDTIAPAVPTVTSPTQTTSLKSNTVLITGTAEAGSLVQVYNDANNNGILDNGDTIVGSEQLTSGQTDYSIDATLAVNAGNNLLVVSTDAGGNVSTPVAIPTITQDSINPTSPTPAPGSSVTPTSTTASTTTLTGTAEAGSLVQIWGDTNNNGLVDDGEQILGFQQLGPNETSYSVNVPLTPNADNHFVVTATDEAGNRSSALVVPTITRVAFIQGTVYLDTNANGVRDPGESGLAGRVLYLDLDLSGTFNAGDVTTITDASGHFAFTEYAVETATVRELPSLDVNNRYFVSQTAMLDDETLTFGVVPFSPIAPVPVVPNPFTNHAAGGPNSQYVQSLYRAVLGRDGSPAEVNSWIKSMSMGMTTTQVAARFVNSPEHRTEQVASYYKSFLHRSADPTSVFWVNLLMNGVSEQNVAKAFLNSPEYQAAHSDSSLFVRDLYLDVLGRQGSEAEVAAWQTALNSGRSRASVEATFVGSAEANDQIVQGFYVSLLHRGREARTSDFWTVKLGQGDSVSDVAIGILTSNEFVTKAKASTLS